MRGDSVEERRFKGPIRGQVIFALLFWLYQSCLFRNWAIKQSGSKKPNLLPNPDFGQ
jgi:hypothetical protein